MKGWQIAPLEQLRLTPHPHPLKKSNANASDTTVPLYYFAVHYTAH